jgi:hypothetical protein
MDNKDPARQSRQAYIALFSIIIGVALAFVALPVAVAAVLAPFGLVGAICALAVGSIRAGEARERARMERGEGVLARWTLDATLWQEFVRLNKGTIVLPRIDGKRSLSADFRVEVVFAEDAIYVDGDCYSMNRGWSTAATLEPAFIELVQGGQDYHTPMRIPIPPGSRSDAERIALHFNAPV